MKTHILVTVKEFVDNGGQMYKHGGKRQLFYKSGNQFDCQIDDIYAHLIKNDNEAYYVKVPITINYI